MNTVWTPVVVGAASAVASAVTLGAMAQLGPLSSRLMFPSAAVIAVAGDCPLGWHRYDAGRGRYLVGADGKELESGTVGQAPLAGIEYRNEDLPAAGEIVISALKRQSPLQPGNPRHLLVAPDNPTGFIALSLCQPP